MTLKNDGRSRKSKASRSKGRKKQCRCKGCNEKFEYSDGDLIKISGLKYIECPMCGKEIILK